MHPSRCCKNFVRYVQTTKFSQYKMYSHINSPTVAKIQTKDAKFCNKDAKNAFCLHICEKYDMLATSLKALLYTLLYSNCSMYQFEHNKKFRKIMAAHDTL